MLFFCLAVSITAQTTAFSYQGSLKDSGNPANGSFQMQFKLFDSQAGAGQIGSTITDVPVTVSQGVFSVNLDFGAIALSGANRWLEIGVRHNSGEGYTTLSPREQIASAPYSVRTLSAASADNLSTACVGCVQDSNINSVSAAKVTGTVANAANATNASNAANAAQLGGVNASEYVTNTTTSFIRNQATFQPTSNFNISGNGTVGTNLTVGGALITNNGATITGINGDGAVVTARRSSGDPFVIIDATTVSQNSILAYRKSNLNRWLMFADNSAEAASNAGSDFRLDAYNNAGTGIGTHLFVKRSTGNVGLGTTNPLTRLTLSGGVPWTINGWTASMNLQNGSAFGWEANASGERFGIGQTNGGLFFFRTFSGFGGTAFPANYYMTIRDDGNIIQPRANNGLVKATLYVNANGTIARCYNGITGLSIGGCGFSVSHPSTGIYDIDFGFQVSDRFINLTLKDGCFGAASGIYHQDGANANTARVAMDCGGTLNDRGFYASVF